MMNIVNIFTQHSKYLTMLCNNVRKIEPKYCDNGCAHTPVFLLGFSIHKSAQKVQ